MKPLASKPTITSMLSLAIWSENKSMSFLWASGLPNKANVSLKFKENTKPHCEFVGIDFLVTWMLFLALENLDTFWDCPLDI